MTYLIENTNNNTNKFPLQRRFVQAKNSGMGDGGRNGGPKKIGDASEPQPI
jgi:hypothetical protein